MNINDTYNNNIKDIINKIKLASSDTNTIKQLPTEIESNNNYIYYLNKLLQKYKGSKTKLYYKLINIYNIYIDNYDTIIKDFVTMSDTENEIYKNIFSETPDSFVTTNEYIFLCIVIITIKIKNRLKLKIIPDLNYGDVFSSYESLTSPLRNVLPLVAIPDSINREIPIGKIETINKDYIQDINDIISASDIMKPIKGKLSIEKTNFEKLKEINSVFKNDIILKILCIISYYNKNKNGGYNDDIDSLIYKCIELKLKKTFDTIVPKNSTVFNNITDTVFNNITDTVFNNLVSKKEKEIIKLSDLSSLSYLSDDKKKELIDLFNKDSNNLIEQFKNSFFIDISDLINNNPQFKDSEKNVLKQYYERDTKLYNNINGLTDPDKKYILIFVLPYYLEYLSNELIKGVTDISRLQKNYIYFTNILTDYLFKIYSIKNLFDTIDDDNIGTFITRLNLVYNKIIDDTKRIYTYVKNRGEVSKNDSFEIFIKEISKSTKKNKYLFLEYKPNINDISENENYFFGPFDNTFISTETEKVTNQTISKDLLEDKNSVIHKFINGNVNDLCLIGYGQSGSGKTSTFFGYTSDKTTENGILHNILNNEDKKITSITFDAYELYSNTTILEDIDYVNFNSDNYKVEQFNPGYEIKRRETTITRNRARLEIDRIYIRKPKTFVWDNNKFIYDNNNDYKINDEKKEESIKDLKTELNPIELFEYLKYVLEKRKTNATSNNPDSSRSHLLIKLLITYSDPIKPNKKNIIICDLAGVENKFNCDNVYNLIDIYEQFKKSEKYKKNPVLQLNEELCKFKSTEESKVKLTRESKVKPTKENEFSHIKLVNNSLYNEMYILFVLGRYYNLLNNDEYTNLNNTRKKLIDNSLICYSDIEIKESLKGSKLEKIYDIINFIYNDTGDTDKKQYILEALKGIEKLLSTYDNSIINLIKDKFNNPIPRQPSTPRTTYRNTLSQPSSTPRTTSRNISTTQSASTPRTISTTPTPTTPRTPTPESTPIQSFTIPQNKIKTTQPLKQQQKNTQLSFNKYSDDILDTIFFIVIVLNIVGLRKNGIKGNLTQKELIFTYINIYEHSYSDKYIDSIKYLKNLDISSDKDKDNTSVYSSKMKADIKKNTNIIIQILKKIAIVKRILYTLNPGILPQFKNDKVYVAINAILNNNDSTINNDLILPTNTYISGILYGIDDRFAENIYAYYSKNNFEIIQKVFIPTLLDYIIIGKLHLYCKTRLDEGYLINHSLYNFRKDFEQIVVNNISSSNNNITPIFYEKEILPYCRNSLITLDYDISNENDVLNYFYKHQNKGDIKYNKIFEIINNNFSINPTNLYFGVFTTFYMNNGEVNNPPKIPYINLNKDKYDLIKIKNYIENKKLATKECSINDIIINKEKCVSSFTGDQLVSINTDIKNIKKNIIEKINKHPFYEQLNIDINNIDIFSLFSLIDNNNASTLIGSLESTDNIQTIIYNKSFSTCAFNKEIYNEFEKIKKLDLVKINTGITKSLYNKEIDKYDKKTFSKKYMKYKSKYLLLKNEMIKSKLI